MGDGRTRRRIPPVVRTVTRRGSPPSVSSESSTGSGRDAVVDWALYVEGVRSHVDSYADAVARARAGEGFVWIGLHEPDERELGSIADDFGLHPLAVEDAVHAHQRPKLESYESGMFIVLKTLRYVPHTELTATSEIVETGEVMVFLGAHFVVTVRHGEHGELRTVRHGLENQPELLRCGPSAVLHAVADTVVDAYIDVSDHVEDDIEEIEEAVFSGRQRRDVARIYQVKRELLELRRAVAPLTGPLRALAGQPNPLVHEQVRQYFRDVDDHLTRVKEQIAGYDELLTSIVQASLAQLSIAENEDMRKITAWAAIFAVPTAIAGIYGMNFQFMPELYWTYGYPTVLLVILVICAALYANFKRRDWL